MKKFLSIVLVSIALTNIVGFMPLYFSELQEIKGEVRLKLSDESELQKLQIPDAEYNNPAVFSATDDNEFSFKGRMYDFKTVKKVDGGYVFYTLEDDKESNLIDLLKAAYGRSDENSKNTKMPLGNLLKNFSKDFVGCFANQLFMPLSGLSRNSFFAPHNTCKGYYQPAQNPPDSNC